MNAQAIMRRISILLPLIVATPVGAAEIVAKVSRDAVPVGQPFQLFLNAKGEVASPPDLSVLHSAFEVLGRSQRRNFQVINGRSMQNASLTLTLRPKSPGKQTIPSISFGKYRSQPINLEVTGGYQGTPQAWQQPRALRTAQGYSPVPPMSEYKALRQPQSPTQETAVDQPTAPASNVWRWVALSLAVGWAFTAGAWAASRRRRSQGPSRPVLEGHSVESTPQTPPSALDLALKGVEEACASRDAERIKGALLDWGRHLWPEDPPSNLSSLAQRCPLHVGKGILAFERALYSPTTEPRVDQKLWRLLAEVSAQGGKKAA